MKDKPADSAGIFFYMLRISKEIVTKFYVVCLGFKFSLIYRKSRYFFAHAGYEISRMLFKAGLGIFKIISEGAFHYRDTDKSREGL